MNESVARPPKWYTAQEIEDAVRQGRFFHKGLSIEESIALHLQAAFEKGFSQGKRVDREGTIASLRAALEERIWVWNDPEREYLLCDLCSSPRIEGHRDSCPMA